MTDEEIGRAVRGADSKPRPLWINRMLQTEQMFAILLKGKD